MHRTLMLLTVAMLFVLAGSGCSSDSKSTVSPPTEDLVPPAAPVNLTVTEYRGEITVAWNENSEVDLDGYRVFCSKAGGVWKMIDSTDMARFVYTPDDETILEYEYRVSAYDVSGNESARSASAGIRVDSTLPDHFYYPTDQSTD